MQKALPILIVVAILAAGGGFVAGKKLSKTDQAPQAGQLDFSNLSQEERRARFQSGEGRPDGGDGGFRRFGGQDGATPIGGEIISKTDDSIVIKLEDDSTRIIFITDETSINKQTQGSIEDLAQGSTIFGSGIENPDGSLTASVIQLGNFSPRIQRSDDTPSTP